MNKNETVKAGSHIIVQTVSIASVASKSLLAIGEILWEHYRDVFYPGYRSQTVADRGDGER